MRKHETNQRIGKISGSNRIQIRQAAEVDSSSQVVEEIEDSDDVVLEQFQAQGVRLQESVLVDAMLQNLKMFADSASALTSVSEEILNVSADIRRTLAKLDSQKSNFETKLKLTLPILPSLLAIEHTFKLPSPQNSTLMSASSRERLFQTARMMLMRFSPERTEPAALPPHNDK